MDTIRCCIACILPCGALDVVRIVHSNGRVEEISGPVLAGDIMKAYPKHVLRKPPSTCPADGGAGIVVQKPVVLPPNAELQKGKIYFLMPVMAAPAPAPAPEKAAAQQQGPAEHAAARRRRRKDQSGASRGPRTGSSNAAAASGLGGCGTTDGGEKERLLANERYLSEIMKENTARDRRRGRVAVWRPHLESITEDDL